MTFDEILATFVFYFAVIDPIGTIPVFIAVTKGYTSGQKRVIAAKSVFISLLVLLFFVVAAEHILDAINVSLAAFQIAGGIVLFLFALTMIFGDSKPESEIKSIKSTTEAAIFPLAIPSIASPGAMLTAVLLTSNVDHSIVEQALSTVVMASVLLLVLILLILSSFIDRIIGNSGASVISRVMGLILSAVAVSNVIEGIKESFL